MDVIAVVLSDVLFFLQENNQKYSFFAQDNKVRSFVYLHIWMKTIIFSKCTVPLLSSLLLSVSQPKTSAEGEKHLHPPKKNKINR